MAGFSRIHGMMQPMSEKWNSPETWEHLEEKSAALLASGTALLTIAKSFLRVKGKKKVSTEAAVKNLNKVIDLILEYQRIMGGGMRIDYANMALALKGIHLLSARQDILESQIVELKAAAKSNPKPQNRRRK
jgi:hypothetical protein